jgi:ABC-type protease/lipase transport system fused ATPase/permease subunit
MLFLKKLDETVNEAYMALQKYMDSSEEYYKLQLFKFLTIFMSFLIKLMVIGGLCLLAASFIAVCMLTVLTEVLDSLIWASLIVGGFFALLGYLVYANRKAIDSKVLIAMSKNFKFD